MIVCECGAGWETFSGHALWCPRNVVAGEVRERVEREDRADFEDQVPRSFRARAWEPPSTSSKAGRS